MTLLLAPLFMQGLLMGLDDLILHRRRGLPRWERIGHPIDTLSVIVCVLYLLLSRPDPIAFLSLAAFSCLLVTKDEVVHSSVCEPIEHWLHAVLFLLHPVCLYSLYRLRSQGELFVLRIFLEAITLFFFHQIFSWNYLWKSTIKSTTTSESAGTQRRMTP